jgi:hypothetical protein
MRQLRSAKAAPEADCENASAAFATDRLEVGGFHQCFGLIGTEPIAQPDAEFLGSLHAPNARRELGAEQAGIGGLISQSSHGGQSQVNRGRSQVTGFQLQLVTEDDGLVEGQSGLRTIPSDEIVDGKPVGTLRIGRTQSVQDGYLGVVQIGKAKDSFRTGGLFLWAPVLHGSRSPFPPAYDDLECKVR